MINFGFGEDLQLIRDTVHDFAVNEIRDIARKAETEEKVPEMLEKKYTELAMSLIDYPEEVGGAGMDVRSAVVLYEELAWGDPAIALSLDFPGFAGLVVRFFGNNEQRQKYLVTFADPSKITKYGAVWNRTFDPYDTESVTVRYEEKNGHFYVRGTGFFVHNFDVADKYVVLALPEGENSLEKLQAFVVDPSASGIKIGRKDDKLGLISFRTGQVEFDNVEVEDVLCEAEDPVKALEEVYKYWWLRVGAMILGAARAGLEYATDYAQERVAFGQPIAKHQGLAFMISDMAILLEGARDFLWEAAWKVSKGKATLGDVAGALAQVIDAADRIGPDSIQVLGGHGYIKDHPVEKWTRDEKSLGLLAGSLLVIEDVASKFIVKEGGK